MEESANRYNPYQTYVANNVQFPKTLKFKYLNCLFDLFAKTILMVVGAFIVMAYALTEVGGYTSLLDK